MIIRGLGTDIIEIDRIERMLSRHKDQFLTRVYTPTEVEYCQRHKNASQHFAGRWAAKEAVLKALGTGMIAGLRWQEIEVLPQTSGKPAVTLTGGTGDIAASLGIAELLITISHCKSYATATAIGLGLPE